MKIKSIISILFISSALIGCISNKQNVAQINDEKISYSSDIQLTINQVLGSSSLNNPGESFYNLGKNYEKQQQFDHAIIAYQQAIKLNPKNIKALESLAVAYAKQKNFVAAVETFKVLVGIKPTANNYNNLGYAYYLNQEFDESENALSKAVKLNPNYVKAQDNLKLVAQANESAQQATIEQANPTKEMNVKEIVADAQIVNHLDVAKNTNDKDNDSTLRKISKGIYEILPFNQNNVANVEKMEESSVTQLNEKINSVSFQANENNTILTLQIVNGNGVNKLARIVSEKVAISTNTQIRTANLKPFNQKKTVVQYRSEHFDEAIKLMNSMNNQPEIVRNDRLPKSVGMRLILGKDFDLSAI